MGQLKGSDRALGFRWPTNHPPTVDMKRTTFAADTRTVTEKIFERCPFFFQFRPPLSPNSIFLCKVWVIPVAIVPSFGLWGLKGARTGIKMDIDKTLKKR